MCEQTVLRFWIPPTETFFNSIACSLIKKYGTCGVVQPPKVFEPVYHVAFKRVL